jgi:hypothetical protein
MTHHMDQDRSGMPQMKPDGTREPLQVHPVAALFPMLTNGELAGLAADIKANGLIHPIITDATGTILIGDRQSIQAR